MQTPRIHWAFCFPFLFSLSLLSPNVYSSAAEDIFKQIDNSGKVVYSNHPQGDSAERTQLPSIIRENIDNRIDSIRQTTPKNCTAHGGEDCSQGPDGDGSVLCLDGYRDAILPFRFACLEARLSYNSLQFFDSQGKALSFNDLDEHNAAQQISSAGVSVRNISNVKAEGMDVVLLHPKKNEFIALEGPLTIDPFGVGDYRIAYAQLDKKVYFSMLVKLQLKVWCTNCGAVSKAR